MRQKNQKGFSPLIILLILVLIAALGIVGWMVLKKDKKADSATTASSESAKETSTASTEKSTLPEGWTAYTIGETRIEIGFPSSWGDPSISTEDGYSTYNYDSPVSDGKTAYSVTFSGTPYVSAHLYSNDYINGPHGGSTTYGTVGFCKTGTLFKLKSRVSDTDSAGSLHVGEPACSGEDLTGTVSELSGGEAIYDQGEPICSEGGCSATANILVKKLSTTEFTAIVLIGDTNLTLDQATKFADSAHGL